MLHEPVGYLSQQMIPRVATVNAMIAVGVDKFLEVLICLNHSLTILESVLWMNIIVSKTMNEKECSMQVANPILWGYVITCAILLWGSHISLCVDRVIEAPVGWRCDCHTATEYRSAL